MKSFCQKQLKCKPVFIDNTINELDFSSNDLIDCNYSLQKSFDKFIEENNLREKCPQICPKDCHIYDIKFRTFNYEMDINMSEVMKNRDDQYLNNLEKYPFKKRLVSDSTQPMFVYNEESVMSFTHYMCYCGGLIGLWFGTSAKDVIVLLLELRLWIAISTRIHLFLNRGNIVVNFR